MLRGEEFLQTLQTFATQCYIVQINFFPDINDFLEYAESAFFKKFSEIFKSYTDVFKIEF